MFKSLLSLAAGLAAASASAATITVLPETTSINTPYGTVAIGNLPGESRNGGVAKVSDLQPRAGNGSLEIRGDRTRYAIGGIYGGPALFQFDQLDSISFDWRVDDTSEIFKHATPAVRLHIMDGNVRSEMIWEGVYDGGKAGVTPATGVWTPENDPIFYLNVRSNAATFSQNTGLGVGGDGVVTQNGGQINLSLGGWNPYLSDAAYVTGISFGSGGGFGTDFLSFVDSVNVTVDGETTTFNFENKAPVPEPAALALLGLGVLGIAASRRRRV